MHASLNLGVTAWVSALPSFGLQVRGREGEKENVCFGGGKKYIVRVRAHVQRACPGNIATESECDEDYHGSVLIDYS